MFTLCGFSASNYYNMVKLALLEKGAAFEEEQVWPGKTDPDASPLGKVPYCRTEHGTLCESSVIAQYIESTWPAVPLLPADPFAAAQVRELMVFIELHLELVARHVYGESFFGMTVPDATKSKTEKQLSRNLPAFASKAHFDTPFIAGHAFTLADCSAIVHLPVIGRATKTLFGRDMVAEALPASVDYLKRMGERPAVQRIRADAKACGDDFRKYIASLSAKA